MNVKSSRGRLGFTLVELMTVIAIIVLLIGVLIPALSSARTSARKATTAGMIKAIDSGCELFRNDFKQYPRSRGTNPFEHDNSQILLMGFQWLGLQLVGPDSRGLVDWRNLGNDTNGDKVVDGEDWLEWYAINPQQDHKTYDRLGPYANVDGDAVQSIRTFKNVRTNHTDPPAQLIEGNTEWKNDKIPFFVDSFANPVLYYRANPQTDQPFTTGDRNGTLIVGQYDQTDNFAVTGTSGTDGYYADLITSAIEGWDIAGSGYAGNFAHDLGEFGYDPAQPTTFPQPKTFAYFFLDGKIFDSTKDSNDKGRLWPYRPDTFILISAGPDGVYGNSDDITNFQAAR